MNYWWVNQGQTHDHEIPGGYLWAPKLDQKGRHRLAYDSMLSLKQGDCVFSYFGSSIRVLGVVMNEARSCARPDFGFSSQFWENDRWIVDVEFRTLTNAFDPKIMLQEYEYYGPSNHGPINSVGKVNMEYLYAIPTALGAIYLQAISIDVNEVQAEGQAERNLEIDGDAADEEEQRIRDRTDVGPTEKRALTLARRGQGYFKKEVANIERGCRLTGVTERRYLRKPHQTMEQVRGHRETQRLERSIAFTTRRSSLRPRLFVIST
jgi:putative restriction endonuclease